MSGSSDQHPSKHVINMIDLETAICEAQADALLLMLAIEDMGRGDAWNFLNKEPQDGYARPSTASGTATRTRSRLAAS